MLKAERRISGICVRSVVLRNLADRLEDFQSRLSDWISIASVMCACHERNKLPKA